jgi:hypothetical protein
MAGPGPVCTWENEYNVDDGTSSRMPSRVPGPLDNDLTQPSGIPPHSIHYLPGESVSAELADAPKMCVPTSLDEISLAQMSVLSWLVTHRAAIIAAEQRFRVDRRAIAGAVAWEALMNVRGTLVNRFGHFAGPGKGHVWAGLGSTDTLVRQVEEASWLPRSEQIPKQSYAARVKLLQTSAGSITYIAAAMNAAAHLAENAGFPSIRKRPEVLTNFWQSKDLKSWEDHLKKKPIHSDFKTGNDETTDMDYWVVKNLKFLEDGVGKPEF